MTGGTHLYIIQMDRTGAIKVGRSNDVERRCKQLQTSCPYPLIVLLVAKRQGNREQEVHRRLKAYRTASFQGEWFREPALGELPTDLYEMLDIEFVNSDWWKKPPEPGVGP